MYFRNGYFDAVMIMPKQDSALSEDIYSWNFFLQKNWGKLKILRVCEVNMEINELKFISIYFKITSHFLYKAKNPLNRPQTSF